MEHLHTSLSVKLSTPNRNTPNKTSPAEAFLGRPVRTPQDLFKKPDSATPVTANHKQFNRRHGSVKREFEDDDLVYVKYHQRNTKSWIPGRIVEQKSSVNYIVQLDLNGRKWIISSHVSQLRHRYDTDAPEQIQRRLPWEILIKAAEPRKLADQEEADDPVEIEIPIRDPNSSVLPEPDPREGGSGTNTVVLPRDVAQQKPASPPKPPAPKPPTPKGLSVGRSTRPIRASQIPRWLKLYDIS